MTYTDKPIVTYIRVSTASQGRSGLGLAAQQAAIDAFVAQHNCKILASFQEIESAGKKGDRPKLREALAHARRSRAVLVVAKLDRLARNVKFLSEIMESKVEFTAIDMPHSNRMVLHIMMAVAEYELEMISSRVKAALSAAKERGTPLGASRPECRKLTQDARKRGARHAGQTAKRLADEACTDIGERLVELRRNGATLQSIANQLNAEGNLTRFNKQWTATQVRNVVLRYSLSPTPA